MPAGRLLGCLSIPSSVDQRKRTRGTKRVSQIDVLTCKCWRYGCEWETTNPSWLKCRPDIHRTFALPPKVWYESHNPLLCLLSTFGLVRTTHRWCLLGTLWFDLVKEKKCVPSFTDLVSHFSAVAFGSSPCVMSHHVTFSSDSVAVSFFIFANFPLPCLHCGPLLHLPALLCDPRLLCQMLRFTLETCSNWCKVFSGQEDWPQSTGGVIDSNTRKQRCSAIMCGKMLGWVWLIPCLQDSQNTM